MNYVKKLPANGNFVVALDLRAAPLGPGIAVVASSTEEVVAAADRTVPSVTPAAALWRRQNGFSELMALRVPWLVVFPSELAKQATPEHGAWLRYRTSDEGVGVGLHLMVAMKSLKQRAPQVFAHVALLPMAASFASFSARGFNPRRGDPWWEAGARERVTGYKFTIDDTSHLYYQCDDSWAMRFSVRRTDGEWVDLVGDPRPATVAAAPAAVVAKRAPRKPASAFDLAELPADAPARLLAAGQLEALIDQLGPTAVAWQWLSVAASLEIAGADDALSGFEAAIASRWDASFADLHNDVADWFATGAHGLKRNQRLAKLHRAAAVEQPDE
jgi:hypothetical protein